MTQTIERTQYLDTRIVEDVIGKRNPRMGDYIALAEARVIHEMGDVSIVDVVAHRLRNSDGYAVTLTLEVEAIEDPTHVVTVLGGHSLYCHQCDRTVATLTLVKRNLRIRGDKRHEREVRALINPDKPIVWDLNV